MTASDQIARPPDAPPPGPEWLPFPDARDYQASHRGKIRSFKRDPGGLVMKLRPDPDGYLRFNYTDDKGERHHNVSVARMVLLAHDPGGYRPGMHACHKPGASRQDNRWPEIIYWGTEERNRLEALAVRLENNPPKVKPPKVCPRCGAEHHEKGRNCRACFEGVGVQFARLVADGTRPEKAAELVDYPLAGALNLAVLYGGLRFVVENEINAALQAASHAESSPRWLRRVINRAGAWLADSDGE